MTSMRHNEILASRRQGGEISSPITEAQIQGLPEPVQRYLRYAEVVGKEPVRTVHLKQRGFMRTQPGQRWMPLVAEQDFTINPPAFVWRATVHLFPLVSISAVDEFFEGHGSMRIKLLSFIPMGNAQGPKMDQGELQRYLGEMVWFPTAWLSSDIEWQAIDENSAQATMRQQDITASVVLHINEQGQLFSVTAQRYMAQGKSYQLVPWSVRAGEYQEADGMRIPTQVEVTWHLPSGDFTWFRVKISEIEYNRSGRITRF